MRPPDITRFELYWENVVVSRLVLKMINYSEAEDTYSMQVTLFNPISPGGGALSAHSLLISRLLFFFSRKRVFLLFDFYYFGVGQFLVKKKLKFFLPHSPPRGVQKNEKI